jgi:transposase
MPRSNRARKASVNVRSSSSPSSYCRSCGRRNTWLAYGSLDIVNGFAMLVYQEHRRERYE